MRKKPRNQIKDLYVHVDGFVNFSGGYITIFFDEITIHHKTDIMHLIYDSNIIAEIFLCKSLGPMHLYNVDIRKWIEFIW